MPLPFVDVDDGPAVGRPVRGITDGFAQFGLWLRLALAAIDDWRATAPPIVDGFWKDTAVIACLPHLDEERFALPTRDLDDLLQTGFFEPLLEILGAPITTARRGYAFGHCAAAMAVEAARDLLAKDAQLRRVLLLGADSTCDAQSLSWLSAARRLKNAENPVGVIPGEAGAAVWVERADGPAQRDGTLRPKLHHAALADGNRDDSAADTGRRLANVVQDAVTRAGITNRCDAWLDQNGELWRAEAWGHALVHLNRCAPIRDVQPIVLASSLGELGAAQGLLAAVFAARSFARGHARAEHALVCTLDEHRRAAAFCVGTA